MDLDFSPEQDMLREMVRGVCAAANEQVRRFEDDPVGYDEGLWGQLSELGVTGLTIDERHGGSAMTLLDAVIVYEELGRSLVPTPHFVSSVLAAGVIARSGIAAQADEWLPRLASGETVMSVGWLEPEGAYGPRGVQTRATADGTGYTLDGVKRHVAFAAAAERLVVLARTGGDPAAIELFLVDPAGRGVTLTQQTSLSSDTQYRVDLDGARGERIGASKWTGWSTWEATMGEAVILAAAQAVGGASRALELTVQYAKDREQFDKPLGAFQAIAHYLADAKTEVDGATLLVYEAAWSAANGRDVTTLGPMAKLFACQVFRDVTAVGQQVFGGVGFTTEYDIQLFFRRAKALQLSWWDDRELEERIAAGVLDG